MLQVYHTVSTRVGFGTKPKEDNFAMGENHMTFKSGWQVTFHGASAQFASSVAACVPVDGRSGTQTCLTESQKGLPSLVWSSLVTGLILSRWRGDKTVKSMNGWPVWSLACDGARGWG